MKVVEANIGSESQVDFGVMAGLLHPFNHLCKFRIGCRVTLCFLIDEGALLDY